MCFINMFFRGGGGGGGGAASIFKVGQSKKTTPKIEEAH